MTTNPDTDELIIDESNFDKYFRDVRQSRPGRGDVISRFTAIAELVDGRLKRDLVSLLKMPNKAQAAANVMRKLGCATEKDSYRICKEMAEDLFNDMSDDDVCQKLYEYQMEGFYYTKKEYVPKDDPHWSIIAIKNLDEFLDSAGTKLESKWTIADEKQKTDEKTIDTDAENVQ